MTNQTKVYPLHKPTIGQAMTREEVDALYLARLDLFAEAVFPKFLDDLGLMDGWDRRSMAHGALMAMTSETFRAKAIKAADTWHFDLVNHPFFKLTDKQQ